jgi:hypothetical protein
MCAYRSYVWVHDYDVWGTAPNLPFHDIAGVIFVSSWFMNVTVAGWEKQGVTNYHRLQLVIIPNCISDVFQQLAQSRGEVEAADDVDLDRMLSLSAPVKVVKFILQMQLISTHA